MNTFARDTNRKTKAKEKLNIYEIRFCSFRSLFGLFVFRSTLSNRFRYSMMFAVCIRSHLAKPPCAATAVAATLKRHADKPQRSRRWRKHNNDTDTTFNHFRHNVFIWGCVEFASLKCQVAATGITTTTERETERCLCVCLCLFACVCVCTGENYCVLI